MKHASLIACCLMAFLAVSSTAKAQNLIINSYASGTNINALWGGGDPANITTNRALGGTYSFYGSNLTAADISTNGTVFFTGNNFGAGDGGLPGSGGGLPAIAVLRDSLRSYSAIPTRAFENIGANFYAMTWENIGQFGQPTTFQNTFQMVWFNGPVTIGIFNFQAGDIAFDYAKISGSFNGGIAVVGLDNNPIAVLPGTSNGIITDATAPGLLPINDDRFVLFRDNGAGGYNVSLQSLTAVPEPSTVVLTATGLGAIVLGYRRNRRRNAKRRTGQPKVQAA